MNFTIKNTLLVALLFGSATVVAQNAATNIRLLTDAGQQKIRFVFTIPMDQGGCLHSVKISTGNPSIVPKTTTGTDLVLPGENLEATWNFGADGYSIQQISTLEIFLTTENTGKQKRDNRLLLNHVIAAIGGAGGGLLIYEGARTERSAYDGDYKTYREKKNPFEAPWTTIDEREVFYQRANKEHRKAQALKEVGIGVCVAAAAFFTWNLIKARKKRCPMTRSKMGFSDPPFEVRPGPTGSWGAGLAFVF